MRLYLLRHAKTDQNSSTGFDIDRELLPKGIMQAKLLEAYFMNPVNLEVHCSSSRRTIQTFELLFKDKQFHSIHFTQELYLSSSKDLLHYVTNLDSKNDILIIGHNDGISEFASYISGENLHFKTATLALFEAKIDSWGELTADSAMLVDYFHPKVD